MKRYLKILLPILAAPLHLVVASEMDSSSPLMPRTSDYTHQWWAEGFPGRVKEAPWLRCVQTGNYAFVLDTAAMKIPHLGPLNNPLGYLAAASTSNEAWRGLASAELVLKLSVDGKDYRCAQGGPWTAHGGPRLIESGRFVQRSDVTDLVFTNDEGNRLNVEARFETIAWPDRLGMLLAARPGPASIRPGEASFGRVAGGFGFDGTNHAEFADLAEVETSHFTLEAWAFVPEDYRGSKVTPPWLICKEGNEEVDGNVGLLIVNDLPQARLNIGGGRTGAVKLTGSRESLKINRWNHFVLSYDGSVFRFHLNGGLAGESVIGLPRKPGKGKLCFGRRQDNSGDGYHFRGILDEVRIFNRALNDEEIRKRFTLPESKPEAGMLREWGFRADGVSAKSLTRESWKQASMELSVHDQPRHFQFQAKGEVGSDSDKWSEIGFAFNPATFSVAPTESVQVEAVERSGNKPRPVIYDPVRGWHRVDLDGVVPTVIGSSKEAQNDAIERIKLVLKNSTDTEQTVRLLFEKSSGGFRQHFGAAITGMTAVLRDAEGRPTGIPVQLSKNWHNDAKAGAYAGQWFHGFSQMHLPPNSRIELELTLCYGHWGGVAAASHAQLCLIGWGTNQLWDQSALGSWGESICYEPDQIQAGCLITDVRPVMVNSMKSGEPWSWTSNVGGGDFFRLFDASGKRVPSARVRTAYESQGPCLTEVTYAGKIGEGLEHRITTSLGRTDDLVRNTYRVRLDVTKPTAFSRFVLFQAGADTYSYTSERKIAMGNESGLQREWQTQWGGDTYRTPPVECKGSVPWISLHDAVSRLKENEKGAWANRGIVIRAWKAVLGGKPAGPWMAERGVNLHGQPTSTVDLIPPPNVKELQPGDFVEATIELIIVPQFARDYYGPNESLRKALVGHENTWKMIHREAVENDRTVVVNVGKLRGIYPAVAIQSEADQAEFSLQGGLGYVPVTITGLSTANSGVLLINDQPLDQKVHGNDFWQTDYDVATGRWSRTYNVPITDSKTHQCRFALEPKK